MFQIAFSTLGCPDWSWQEIYSMAKDLGYAGIEIRGLGNEIHAAKAQPFTRAELPTTKETLKRLGLSITCFSSSCCVRESAERGRVLAEGFEYIELASEAGCRFVRILGDLEPAPGLPVDDSVVVEALRTLAFFAEYKGVALLVETNGVYADTRRLRAVLEQVGRPNVKALWDIHHPYRYFRETPRQTLHNLDGWLAYVHIKDSIVNTDGTTSYRMLGEGDLPVREALEELVASGFSGFVCLEWVKRWSRDLQDAAVVFPHYAHFMKSFLNEKSTPLPAAVVLESVAAPEVAEEFVAHGQGRRLFEKDILIDLTFGELLETVARAFPDQYAFKYTTRDYTRTYREFLGEVDLIARAFMALGIRKGDHIAIWATNYPQWFLTFWAATRIGAVLIPINTAYKVHEAEYLLRQSDTQTLIMIDGYKDSDYIGIMNTICPELASASKGRLRAERLPLLKNVITIDSIVPGCFHWEELPALAERVPAAEVAANAKNVRKDEVCNIQYTSGTTGFPKGVMLTHYNVINNGKCIGDRMDFTTADRLLIQVPMFHCFGMVLAMTAAVAHGSTMVPIEYFQPARALEAINRQKITAMHGVPTMFIALLEHPDFDQTDFSHMRTGIMAGSPCPIRVMQDVLDKMNATDMTIVFGQTESSPGCTQSRVGDPVDVRVATVGRPLPGVECRIVDPATNEPLPDNVPGEFVARGYNIMRGYYKMPEATASAIDVDGWLHTGDLALRTPEGNFKITGRIKDMIIRGGENIYPKEIEEFLYTHPSVKDVQVIGVPDKIFGEEIMACLVLKPGEVVSEEEIKTYVRGHMAKHKTPRYVAFVDDFPMNAAGKILKYKMRDWATEMLGLGNIANIETA